MLARVHILLLLLAVTACLPLDPSETDELQEAVEQWERGEPAAYRFLFQRGDCECLVEWVTPKRITVIGGEVMGVVDESSGREVPPHPVHTPTIDALLARIEVWMGRRGTVSGFYDGRLGYPTFAELRSPFPDGSDSFSVTEFEVLPAAATASILP